MNNLTEIKNHRVLYDGKDGKLILPLNFGATKELVPWVKDVQPHTENRIKGSVGFPYILLINDKSYIIVDTGSKMPTLYSGDYLLFSELSYNAGTPHKILAHKQEISKLLKLRYSPKQRIKFNMPYTEDELLGFSKKNQFAKAVYDIIEGGSRNLERNIDKLDNFFGDDVVLAGDHISPYNMEDTETIEFSDWGIELFTPTSLYKESYLVIDGDEDWAFDSAMGTYTDCEEMSDDELTYIDHHFSPKTNEKFIDIVNRYEPDYWKEEGINPTSQTTIFNSEGVYDNFLTGYFRTEWDDSQWEVLEAIGCAVWRARQEAVADEIKQEVTYEMEATTNGFYTKISYPQLLQLIGSGGINNFSELREWDINEIGYNLSDSWYDAWDIDEDGLKDINYAMMRTLDEIDEKYKGNYEDSKNNREVFKKLMDHLKFRNNTNMWGAYPKQWVLDIHTPEGKNMRKVVLSHFNEIDNTVTIHTLSGDDTISKTEDFKVDGIMDEVTNLKLPFPEEEIKNEKS